MGVLTYSLIKLLTQIFDILNKLPFNMELGFKIGHHNDHLLKKLKEDATAEYKCWHNLLKFYRTFFAKEIYLYGDYHRTFDIYDIDGDLEIRFPSSVLFFHQYKKLGIFCSNTFNELLDQTVLVIVYNALSRIKYENTQIKSVYFSYLPHKKLHSNTLKILEQVAAENSNIRFTYIDQFFKTYDIDFPQELSRQNEESIKNALFLKNNQHIYNNDLSYGLDNEEGRIMRSLSGDGEDPDIYGF